MMKIVGIRTELVNLPFARPMRTSIHEYRSAGCVLVFLDTDEGFTGESYVFSFDLKRLEVLRGMILSFQPEVVGEDPHYTERMWRKMWQGINFFGHKGVTLFGVSAVDVACWDLRGKAAGKPIHKLVGAVRERVPVYASGGLWLSQTTDELVREAKEFVAQGFTAMKLRIGKPRMEQDLERVREVRRAVGPDIGLMVDANQAFDVNHAVRLGRKLEEFDLIWFEEPVAAYDLEGSARVAAALDVPIASGETDYNRYGFRRMLELRSADILMPDLARMGGYTDFFKAAHMAEAYDVTVSPHIFSEQSLSILGSIPNGSYLEHMPWFSSLFREKMEIKDGMIEIPDRPGTGFTFDPETVEKYRI